MFILFCLSQWFSWILNKLSTNFYQKILFIWMQNKPYYWTTEQPINTVHDSKTSCVCYCHFARFAFNSMSERCYCVRYAIFRQALYVCVELQILCFVAKFGKIFRVSVRIFICVQTSQPLSLRYWHTIFVNKP